MKPVAVTVVICTTCPFADDGEMIGDGEWHCHAVYTAKGWPRHLSDQGSPSKPPKWCPLRKAPILVTLKRGK